MKTHLYQISVTESIQVDRLYLRVKAVIDRLCALMLLIILAPFMLLIALFIRLSSYGPAIYRQRRVGQHQQLFTICKFRTMHIDTPVLSTEEIQHSGIHRITRIGGILRKTSMDELPQLINILRGEMSFIGPRPALPSQSDLNIKRELFGVHRVRPGITGLAQVMGRDNLDTETKASYDAEYCRRINFSLDLKILFMTFMAIMTTRGNK